MAIILFRNSERLCIILGLFGSFGSTLAYLVVALVLTAYQSFGVIQQSDCFSVRLHSSDCNCNSDNRIWGYGYVLGFMVSVYWVIGVLKLLKQIVFESIALFNFVHLSCVFIFFKAHLSIYDHSWCLFFVSLNQS